jgi:hypothetical protein
MARLAKLASIYEKTTRMEWTLFNDLPVISEIAELQEYVNPESVTLCSAEDMGLDGDVDARRNRFHCIEAWRHAIILYTCRVFNQQQDEHSMRKITYLARLVLDSVRCIPQSSIIQKQVLLPVFLAGAEMEREADRGFVRQYCKYWSDTSRFYHFESATELLEDIWCEADMSSRYQYWWGVRVGPESQRHTGDNESMVSEILLG